MDIFATTQFQVINQCVFGSDNREKEKKKAE